MALPTLDREEERDLLVAYKRDGDMKARDRLVDHYMKLVVSKAREVKAKTNTNYGIEDLIMDGTEGLLIALTKFNLDMTSELTGKNIRLGTYARWYVQVWIVGRAMESKSSVYRLNCGRMRGVLVKVHKLSKKHGFDRPLTYDHATVIAAEIGARVTAEDVMSMDRLVGSEVSTDAPIRGEDGASTFGDKISDGFSEDAMAEAIDGQTMQRELDDILSTLTDTERKVIAERVLSEKPGPIGKLAKALGLKQAAVRDIEEAQRSGLIDELRLRLVSKRAL